MTVRRRSIKNSPCCSGPSKAGSLDQTIHHRLGTAIAFGSLSAQAGGRMAQGGTNMQAGANAPLLAVDDVTLQYKTEQHLGTATFRVGFEVYEGERYVVLGPSGCGKSTLLKAVAGFMQPVEGQICLAGKEIDRPECDRRMVFQDFDQLLPWKTVLGNVLFPRLVNRRMPKAEATEHARSVIAKVNLSRFENVYPHMLS